jgi:predicted RNA binding protein YcfA (HicA-like mRNA interferase family)
MGCFVMIKKQDDLTVLKNSKLSIRFAELDRILQRHGWQTQSVHGSHHIYCKPSHLPIMVVRPHGKQKYCHPMDVKKVITALQNESKDPNEENNP